MVENKYYSGFFIEEDDNIYLCSYCSNIIYLDENHKRGYDKSGVLYYKIIIPKYIIKKYNIKFIIFKIIKTNFFNYLNELINDKEIPHDVKVYMFYDYLFRTNYFLK